MQDDRHFEHILQEGTIVVSRNDFDSAQDMDVELEEIEEEGRRRVGGFLFSRLLLTLTTLALLVGLGVFATSALLTDQVTMAAINTQGGTLDIKVDSNTTANQDGPLANWGTFDLSITNMQPGDVRYADLTVRNPGSLPAAVTVSSTGADTHPDDPVGANHCFAFYWRERVAGADVQSIGNGTSWGTATTNAGVVNFETAIAAAAGQLYTNGAARTTTTWAIAESHAYRLTVRMLDGCRQGSGNIGGTTFAAPTRATGTLSFTFDATQV